MTVYEEPEAVDVADVYDRVDDWTVDLVKRHREMIARGFRPRFIIFDDPDEGHPHGCPDCYVCGCRGLYNSIRWVNPAGEELFTGLDCFEHVKDELQEIDAKVRKTLVWANHHHKEFYGRPYEIVEAERVRLMSYRDPLKWVYPGDWERAVSDIYARRKELNLTRLESDVLETLHNKTRPYWTGRLTPKQRKILIEIVRAYLAAGFPPTK